MRLSTNINQVNQTYTQASEAEGQALEQGLKNGLEAIRSKQSGQSITGEVILRNESEILISLGKNQLLQAKFEGNMSAEPGQLLTFMIKSHNNNKVVLSPLFENLNQNPTISRAINAAGMPETGTMVQMVKTMMEEGMPVDRQSIYQMNRILNANPKADIQSLVQMHRLQLPVTEENIIQFEAYKNYTHQLSNGLMDIVDTVSQTFLPQNSDLMQAQMPLYTQVLELLTQSEEAMEIKSDAVPEEWNQNVEKNLLPEAEHMELMKHMEQAGFSEKFLNETMKAPMSGGEILRHINQMLKNEVLPVEKDKLLHFLDSEPFKNLLKNEVIKQWFMPPEEVAQENSVDRLYERLNSQIKQLNQIVSQTTKTDTPFAKTVAQVAGNIDFMNQLNQLFTYIQLPLKMYDKETSGELFVYTNKKNLASKDGAVSALLHLEMAHLGNVNVHVSLLNQKVSTKFYLQDAAALDFIAERIHILSERLKRRGYTMSAEFLPTDEPKSVMEEILSQNKNISVLANYSFDARA